MPELSRLSTRKTSKSQMPLKSQNLTNKASNNLSKLKVETKSSGSKELSLQSKKFENSLSMKTKMTSSRHKERITENPNCDSHSCVKSHHSAKVIVKNNSIITSGKNDNKNDNRTQESSLNKKFDRMNISLNNENHHSQSDTSDLSFMQKFENSDLNNGKNSSSSSNPENQENLKKNHTAGLKNLGNTCFMNSILQCLAHTTPLLEFCCSGNYVADINLTSPTKGKLVTAFANLMLLMWSSRSPINSLELKKEIQKFSPQFTGYSQHDAQEFLRFLLEGLHNDVNRVRIKSSFIKKNINRRKSNENQSAEESWNCYLELDNSEIVEIFVGQLKNTLKCTVCNYTSITFDPFWDLSLPIPELSKVINLQECLRLFTKEETLDDDDKPMCSRCKVKRKCTKILTIYKFPSILILHLKRFSPNGNFREKLQTTVKYPLSLDMMSYCTHPVKATSVIYNLYAVSHHTGTPFSGHYTASCRHPYKNLWYRYNDEISRTILPLEMTMSEAYLLFYERA